MAELSECSDRYHATNRAWYRELEPILAADLFEAILERAHWSRMVPALANLDCVARHNAQLPIVPPLGRLAFFPRRFPSGHSSSVHSEARRKAVLKPGNCPRCGEPRHWARCKKKKAEDTCEKN